MRMCGFSMEVILKTRHRGREDLSGAATTSNFRVLKFIYGWRRGGHINSVIVILDSRKRKWESG